jgi:uncharacterized repeat protein (TIGR03803 family)
LAERTARDHWFGRWNTGLYNPNSSRFAAVLAGTISRSEPAGEGLDYLQPRRRAAMSHTSEKFSVQLSLRTAISALAIVFALMAVATQTAQAQPFRVIYNFTGGQDGAAPSAGLTFAAGGNLYGTAYSGGTYGCGTVFKLAHKGAGWVLNPLYSFQGGSDGCYPAARAVFGSGGSLYGTTFKGGFQNCDFGLDTCGTVFSLKPAPTACVTALCPWAETVLYRFTGGSDGANPNAEVTFDPVGNMYLPVEEGIGPGWGVVLELTPSNGGWKESVLYTFTGGNDGAFPDGGVVFDAAGNLYGVANYHGAYNNGLVYQLTPSGSAWPQNVLYAFQGGSDGGRPRGLLIFDNAGNLYGGTSLAGSGGGGTVFELSPANGNWTLNILYSFTGKSGPDGSLTMDAAGNLYGTTLQDGTYGYGSAFKLTPSTGGWTYTDLHDFTGGNDGKYPNGSLVLDTSGNLYGTTEAGGTNGAGVVFEIVP